MRTLFLVATISALAWARPETYKETEDFQYSRSSSDEGTKSGYYGAQRGNVAGNYERAHNMDSLAQNQMSGAVNQVEGELGDASKTRAGSVYTSANSRGVYGSGRYDLSNLQGRNFGESMSVDSSQSSSSAAYNQQAQNSNWRSQSQRTGYGASTQLGQSERQAADETSGYGASNYGRTNSHSTGYHSASGHQSQSGYSSQNVYDQSNLNGQTSSGYGSQAGDQARRYTVVTPVRLVGRPGTQIAIPVYAQAYDTQRAYSSFDQNASNRQIASQTVSSTFDHNGINSEAEALNNNRQHISSGSSIPVSDGKHYSSSYNYHKAWERQSETTDLPVVAPTVNPLPARSELYEDAQSGSQQANSQNSYSGRAYNSGNRYNNYAQSGLSQSRQQSDYSSQHLSQSEDNLNAHSQGNYGSQTGALVAGVDSQPKSYQSSYSYHKSWEKQGDPYVIVPATNGEASQRITSGSTKNSASSQHYGSQSHQHYSQGSAVDCDSQCRYRRATRSYSTQDYYQQGQETLGQQVQRGWEENLGQNTQQQNRPERLEDLGQQTQQSWGDLQQQSKPEKLENLGQQTLQSWDNFRQQSKPQKLEDLGQQTQQSWNNYQQQSQDLGQQTQQSWDNFQQQSQDLGQQTQQSWDNFQQQRQPQKLEDLGQQTQGKWQEFDQKSESNLEDLGQQTQQSWDKSDIEQQESQQTQGQWDNIESAIQRSQQTFDNVGQQTQNQWGSLDNLGQQTQQNWNNLGNIEQQNIPQQTEDLGQQTQNKWDTTENFGQQVQTQWNNINTINQTRHTDTINTEQQTQTHIESVDQIKPNREHAEDNTQNTFNKEHSNDNNPDDPAFWSVTDKQKHENNNNYHNQQHTYNNHNSSYNSQSYGDSWQEQVNTHNAQTANNNPLQSLWDKIENMEQQSEHSSNENEQHTGYENSQHSYNVQESTYHNDSNADLGHPGTLPPFAFNQTVDKAKNDGQHQVAITEKPEDDVLPEKPEPAEIGRGDIGAEDDLPTDITTPKTVSDSPTNTIQTKPKKTPEEIEALSLSRGTEEDTNEPDALSVLSIGQQKWLDEQRQKAAKESHLVNGSGPTITTNTSTPRLVINENTPVPTVNQQTQDKHSERGLYDDNRNKQSENALSPSLEQPEEIQQHNKAQQFEDIDKNNHNFNQQNTEHGQQNQGINNHTLQPMGQHSQNFDQQNTGKQTDYGQESQQQFQNVGQQSQSLNQQSTGEGLVNFGQQSQDLNQQTTHNLDQQQTQQELEDFGQQSQDNQQNLQQFENSGQHSQNYDQQNTGQQLEDFGQESQQNLQQFQNFGQQSQSFDQQSTGQNLVEFGQQSQDLSKQNAHTLDQQQTGQELEDFGQQSQDLNQQSLQQFENVGPQSQNIEQDITGPQLEDFGQQSQDLNQQNQQQFENLGQNLEQHQAREFVPNSNTQPTQEQKVAPVSDSGSATHAKQDIEIIPPSVVTTEKPGFWRSVGNKFTSAKDSVSSWFKRS